jgi:hypothetical protein
MIKLSSLVEQKEKLIDYKNMLEAIRMGDGMNLDPSNYIDKELLDVVSEYLNVKIHSIQAAHEAMGIDING